MTLGRRLSFVGGMVHSRRLRGSRPQTLRFGPLRVMKGQKQLLGARSQQAWEDAGVCRAVCKKGAVAWARLLGGR